MDLILHIEEFSFIRNFFKKKRQKHKYKTDPKDQFLKRNQLQVDSRKGYSRWQAFKQLISGIKDNFKLDDVQAEVRRNLACICKCCIINTILDYY